MDAQLELKSGRSRNSSAFRMAKRTLDVVGSFVALIIFSVPMVLMALLTWLTSPGPILFRQMRLGLDGVPFTMLKFRTMRADAEQVLRSDSALYDRYVRSGFKLPEGEDPRVTPIGRFLRKTSLDELPQFINVMAGSMSLVGPRPIVPAELDHYGDLTDLFLSVKPGITGYWQVSGRSSVGYPERVALELYYVDNQGFLFDLKILLLTVPSVLTQRGAH